MPVIFVILLVAFDFFLRRSEKFASGVLTAADCELLSPLFRLIPSSFAPCISYTQAIEREIEMWFGENSVLFLVLCKGQIFCLYFYTKCVWFLFLKGDILTAVLFTI